MTATMKSSATAAFSVAAAALLASCSGSMRSDRFEERSDAMYQTAVADYTAGRIDAAVEGFESAVKANPSNASARFQLAVLLQDAKKDYLGAMCWYRGYVLLAPSSDKARLAKERMAECEKLFVASLGDKYNLAGGADLMREIESLKEKESAAREMKGKAEDSLAAAQSKIATLERENASLKSLLKRMGEDEDEAASPPPAPRSAVAAAAAETEGESAPPPPKPAIVAEPPEEKELTVNPEALAIFEEEEREAASRPAALPVPPTREAEADAGARPFPQTAPQNAGGSRLTDLARGFRERPSAPRGEEAVRRHTVEEGETLSLIALKYYGRKSAWKRIQDANKATVPPDGNVKAGQVLTIP